MKKSNKNILIIGIGCMIFLLIISFFTINNTSKGTSAITESDRICPSGYTKKHYSLLQLIMYVVHQVMMI